MAVINFPPIELADEHGLLALGGDLEVETLLLAYQRGIFPWPISTDYPLAWFSPDPRGVLFYKNLHIGKSLQKFLKKNPYEIRFNTQFEAVIMNCSMIKRSGPNSDTWITKDIIESYINLYKRGYAYSVETFLGDALVGGVYGVCINRFYSGESMFHKADNASKIALIALLAHLNKNGISWLDTQMVTPVVKSLGGINIPRNQYIKLLKESISADKSRP